MIWNALFSVIAILPHTFLALGVPAPDREVTSRQTQNKYVFAHFMVGIVENYQLGDWEADMTAAHSIGIDAFALNCASIDSYTPTQLALAYEAAKNVGFKVFISFDFAYWTNGDTAKITEYMRQYASHPAQMQYDSGALVSTFVGDSFDWNPVKQGTPHQIHALPNLQDPAEASSNAARGADGAFSWYAWPTDGGNSIIPGPMTTVWDDRYIQDLAGKTYMAPVSPWFATHYNSKNWVFICENLPTLRWEQMLSMQPDLIEIISWNDYGESHYIGPYSAHHSDDGSSQWAAGMPHDAWRDLYQPYITAYKSGAKTPTVDEEKVVYWYRPTPKAVICTGDQLPAPNGVSMLSDSIFVATILKYPATLTVTSGSNEPVSIAVPAGIVTSNVTMGVGNQSFTVTRDGQTILSGEGNLVIKNSCIHYNFNVYVGSITSELNGINNSTVITPSTTRELSS
ncbi:CAZyme family GH71 [Penicillium longicatenatum]|uniref:CAZyme family GH71 n=1 Tax=Penicillium longicatenatum TaxID=1561947 RepID=UPI002548355F|nr:CAZyme family GH71 [Penicillium longicatenatum]KAJ5642870.1 CAZyme family GH71 [Penicillium longicatenatum]